MGEVVRYDPHNTDLPRKRSGGSGSGVEGKLPSESTSFTSNKLSPRTESSVKESHPFKDPNVSANKIRAKLNRR